MMNSDGTNPTQVGGVTGTPSQPAISPDGTTIALAATVNGVSEIALVHTDGTGFTKLTSDGAHATHPTWLPDGQHLIFSSDRASAIKLYSIATGGSTPQALNLSPNIGTEPSAAGE
jgi:TolB protein